MAKTVDHHHAHHFDSHEHEFDSAKQGMWLFLLQEVLFFSGLFVAYFIFRGMYLEAWIEGHTQLSIPLGALNTVILILSSLTMALAVSAAQQGENRKAAWYLIGTFMLAAGFCVVKSIEYSSKFSHGIFPAGMMEAQFNHPKTPLFFSIYFMMTGIHAIHVIGGMVVILWLIRRCFRNEFGANYYTPVEMVGLYWHFVDLVWIYLFPMLYLTT
jgi:cytochrome c oxidase subunit 3